MTGMPTFFLDRRCWLSYMHKIDSGLLLSIIIFLLYALAVYAFIPDFYAIQNLYTILYNACLLVPVALGVYLLIILGLFDLSVGAVAALSAVTLAATLRLDFPLFFCILLTLGIGLSFGFLNWALVNRYGIPALVATLITMTVARAGALFASKGQVIGGLPQWLDIFALRGIGTISITVVSGGALILLFIYLTQKHVVFRRIFLTGSNREAVAHNGINVSFLEWLAFALAGIGASITGVLQASRTLSASPLIFQDLALDCIAACVIGGVRFVGGRGHPLGVFLGLILVVVSRNLAVVAGAGAYWRDFGIAAILLAAVLLNRDKRIG